MSADLDRELAQHLDREMATASPGRATSARSLPTGRANGEAPQRAVDQLSMAVRGLLQCEEELTALCEEVVGHFKTDADQPAADQPEGLPMFDRVRNDARQLAELAIRLHARIEFMRGKF